MNSIFYNRFEDTCKFNKTTPTALTLKLGLSKGNASSWKKGGKPSVDILVKIADELRCSIDYLLGRTDIKKLPAEAESLTDHQWNVINAYINNPTMQEPINKILGIQAEKERTIFKAARGSQPEDNIIKRDPEKMKKIASLPDMDKDL